MDRLLQALFSYRSKEQPGGIQPQPQGRHLGAAGRAVDKVPVPCACCHEAAPAAPSLLCESQRIHSHFQGSEVRPGHLVPLLHHAVELAVHHHARIRALPCDRSRSRGGSQTRVFNTPALRGGKRQPGASPEPVLPREF